MTKSEKTRQGSGSKHRRATPYPSPSLRSKAMDKKKRQKASEKKDWHDATCSVCMEYPHNAVLLLCSSHHKGCRPYMCATSSRYSNCLDQYKKAYTKVNPTQTTHPWDRSGEDPNPGLGPEGVVRTGGQVSELLCPLCRGQVKGWTVVEPARKYLDSKKRSCTQDGCSFVGSYRALRKHVRAEHPRCRPREVDPSVAEKWKKLENDREMNDVMSTISSTMPGSIVMGDYVIEGGNFARDGDGVVFRLGSYGGRRRSDDGGRFFEMDYESWDDTSDDDEDDVSDDSSDDDGDRVGRRRAGGFRLGHGGRRYINPDVDDVSDGSSDDDDGGRVGRHRAVGFRLGSGGRRFNRLDDEDRIVVRFGAGPGARRYNRPRESYHRRHCTFGGIYGGLRRRRR